MGRPYHFNDLSDAQKIERRVLLDRYANIAQLSTLFPVLAVQVYFFGTRWSRRWASQAERDAPSSPYLKEGRLEHRLGSKRFKLRLRRWAWWLGENVQFGGVHFESRGQVLAEFAWMAWLVVMCVLQTGEDYLHFTKRFGVVAASQLPFHYLLAMKSPYSPLQILTRRSHETLNSYHQLLGRVIVYMLQIHAALYLNFFVQKGLLPAKFKELYIICGVVGILSFTTIRASALEPIRRWNYRVFYVTHVTLAMIWIPVLFFHSPHIRLYLYEAGAVYGLNVLLRTFHSKTFMGAIKLVPDTSLVEITVPSMEQPDLRHWAPGQHAYLSLAGNPASRTFRSNPFSVASIPSVDGHLRFYARILDGNTARLARQANSTNVKYDLTIEGPYGVSTHSNKLLQCDRVLFVAGGVGATFIAPLCRQLLADLSPSKGSYRRQKVTFVWTARSTSDITWALPEDPKEREGFLERLNVYVTGASGPGTIGEALGNLEDQPSYAEGEEGIELEERKNLLSGGDGSGSPSEKAGNTELSVSVGRPDWKRVVDHTFSHSSTEKVAVIVCGPKGLNQSLRKELGRWIRAGRDIWFWEEVFAL